MACLALAFAGIVPAFAQPNLRVTKTHSGNFVNGQLGATYTLTVSNIGTSATSGTVTVTDILPAGFILTGMTGAGFTCIINNCTNSTPLAPGTSYSPITVTVNVGPSAAANSVNTATVSGGGSPSFTTTDPTVVGFPTKPTLAITKTHSGDFAAGQQGATYTIVVSNPITNSSPTSGTVTVGDLIPSGLTIVGLTGNGWNCSAAVGICTRNDALNPGGSYAPITVTVNVKPNATSPQNNVATVVGGGANGATVTDSTNITGTQNPNVLPSLSITKTHVGNFTAGGIGTYTLTVSNAANASPTNAPVTVTDTLPPGLTLISMTGGGFACTLNSCTNNSVLAPGTSYSPITVSVSVAANAASPQVNNASVSGGGSNTANTSDSTVIGPSQPGIILPASVSVDPGGQVPYSISLSQPAGANGVFISLTSSDPTIASLFTPTVFIASGQTTSNVERINGIKQGSVVITATAQGLNNGTGSVLVGLPPGSGTLQFSPGSATITAPNSQNLTLTLSTPAGANGQTISLSSSNTGVATVPATVNVGAGQTSIQVPVTSVAAGTATISANGLPNYGATSATITVVTSGGGGGNTGNTGATIILPANAMVNAGGNAPFLVSLSAAAPSGGVFVTLASTNPNVATLNTTTVFIPEGQTSRSILLVGVAQGIATIGASAQNYPNTAVQVQTVP